MIEAEPGRLREVDGIGPVRARRIIDAWAEQRIVREIMMFLHSNGVGTARALRIYKTYGSDAVQVMTENPHRLTRDVRHRLQDGRRDSDETRRREDRDDPSQGRRLVRPRRGDGRGALRAADRGADPARRGTARRPRRI